MKRGKNLKGIAEQRKNKTIEEIYGEEKAQEMREVLRIASKNHKPDCQCVICKRNRGEDIDNAPKNPLEKLKRFKLKKGQSFLFYKRSRVWIKEILIFLLGYERNEMCEIDYHVLLDHMKELPMSHEFKGKFYYITKVRDVCIRLSGDGYLKLKLKQNYSRKREATGCRRPLPTKIEQLELTKKGIVFVYDNFFIPEMIKDFGKEYNQMKDFIMGKSKGIKELFEKYKKNWMEGF